MEIDREIRIADGDGQRRVFSEVEILTGERRDDHAHGLRQDDQAQGLPPTKSQCARRFRLSFGDGLNAGAHYLGDEAAGINGKDRSTTR